MHEREQLFGFFFPFVEKETIANNGRSSMLLWGERVDMLMTRRERLCGNGRNTNRGDGEKENGPSLSSPRLFVRPSVQMVDSVLKTDHGLVRY